MSKSRVALEHSGARELATRGHSETIRSKDAIPPALCRHASEGPERLVTYHVVSRPDEKWSVRKTGEGRASRVFGACSEAVSYARTVARSRSAELVIHGRDGRIRQRDTYRKDPFPPRVKR